MRTPHPAIAESLSGEFEREAREAPLRARIAELEGKLAGLREAIAGHCKHAAGCNANRPGSYACPDCGRELVRVERPKYLNEDQWDATKAGDFYCAACTGKRGRTGYRYYNSEELPRGECSCWIGAALSDPSPTAQALARLVEAVGRLVDMLETHDSDGHPPLPRERAVINVYRAYLAARTGRGEGE